MVSPSTCEDPLLGVHHLIYAYRGVPFSLGPLPFKLLPRKGHLWMETSICFFCFSPSSVGRVEWNFLKIVLDVVWQCFLTHTHIPWPWRNKHNSCETRQRSFCHYSSSFSILEDCIWFFLYDLTIYCLSFSLLYQIHIYVCFYYIRYMIFHGPLFGLFYPMPTGE